MYDDYAIYADFVLFKNIELDFLMF